MSRTGKIILLIILLAGLGLLAAGGLIVFSLTRESSISSGSVLYVNLNGEIPEEPAGDFLDRVVLGEKKTILDISQMLRESGRDERIGAVVVRIGFLQVGWGKIQELRDAILSVSEAGKPIIAHLEMGGTREYYLASAASQVDMVPSGTLMLNGLAVHLPFAKRALDKIKIRAEIESVGEYKSAGDTFTRDRPRAAHLEEMNALLDDLFGQVVDGIAQSRSLTPDEARTLLDRGLFTADEALEAGLVDHLVYRDEIYERLTEDVSDGLVELEENRYVRAVRKKMKREAQIALIYATGTIVSGHSSDAGYGEKMLGAETLAESIREAKNDDEIGAIVIRVNSPGGSGVASDVIWREIELAKGSKPVVISMSDLGASGGYWISMGADAIVAEPGTLTASIGIVGGKVDLGGLYDWMGVHWELLQRGQNADFFSNIRGFSQEQRSLLRGTMMDLYRDFIAKAAQGRGMSEDQVEKVAEGRVWSGQRAKEIGLIDHVGGISRAVEVAREEAGLSPNSSLGVTILPRQKGFLESLRAGEFRGGGQGSLPAPLGEVVAQLALEERLAREGFLLLLPFEPDIH